MNIKNTEVKESLKKLPLRFIDEFYPILENDKIILEIIKNICQFVEGSCVIFLLSENNIIGSLGIGGKFIGSINFKADADKFPNDKEYRMGKVLFVQNNKLFSDSFYSIVSKINDLI